MRVLSGVQASGKLHLGNYLGAIRNFVTLQKDYDWAVSIRKTEEKSLECNVNSR